jgi:hypothetical protein
MDNLRDKLIRLAHEVPELRKHLVPILQKTAIEFYTEEALQKYLKEHPKADPKKHHVAPSTTDKPGTPEKPGAPQQGEKAPQDSGLRGKKFEKAHAEWKSKGEALKKQKELEDQKLKRAETNFDKATKSYDTRQKNLQETLSKVTAEKIYKAHLPIGFNQAKVSVISQPSSYRPLLAVGTVAGKSYGLENLGGEFRELARDLEYSAQTIDFHAAAKQKARSESNKLKSELTKHAQNEPKEAPKPERKPSKPKAPAKSYQKKYPKAVTEVMDKHKLTDDDADEVRAYRKKKPAKGGVKKTDAQLMKEFLANAKPETKERMKGMSPAEFMKVLGAIMEDEETAA